MSDYHLVSTLHAARVTQADAHKAANAAVVALAEAQAAVARTAAAAATADADVAAAGIAVNVALVDGRVTSSKHLLDLDLDCLGAILSHLGPRDAFSASHTCTTLRSALFRGGLPGPLAGVCGKWWGAPETAATKEAALRALDGMEPALGALRLNFHFSSFDEDHARVLARALDAAPRAARIDIVFRKIKRDETDRLADVLSSPDRVSAGASQVRLLEYQSDDSATLLRLTRAGVCIASIDETTDDAVTAQSAAGTLTRLHLNVDDAVNLTTRFPALRRLSLRVFEGERFTINVPSVTALAPHLKEIQFFSISNLSLADRYTAPTHGFGFEPSLFAQFVAAINGVTRVSFESEVTSSLSQNENENLGQLAALRTLRVLEIANEHTYIELENEDPPSRDPVAKDAITNLPPLAPGLTRLAFSGTMRVAFGHPLPQLRVLDWRGSRPNVICTPFYWHEDDDGGVSAHELGVDRGLDVPLAIPSAALAPNLHTLLIGYPHDWRGDFDLWTLAAARTALRVVVIEHARLLCSAPDGFDTTPAGFAARLARDAKDLVSVHVHGCEIEGGHEPAVENFLRALEEERGGRVCRADAKECLFCMLHDGTDLWPREVRE